MDLSCDRLLMMMTFPLSASVLKLFHCICFQSTFSARSYHREDQFHFPGFPIRQDFVYFQTDRITSSPIFPTDSFCPSNKCQLWDVPAQANDDTACVTMLPIVVGTKGQKATRSGLTPTPSYELMTDAFTMELIRHLCA